MQDLDLGLGDLSSTTIKVKLHTILILNHGDYLIRVAMMVDEVKVTEDEVVKAHNNEEEVVKASILVEDPGKIESNVSCVAKLDIW